MFVVIVIIIIDIIPAVVFEIIVSFKLRTCDNAISVYSENISVRGLNKRDCKVILLILSISKDKLRYLLMTIIIDVINAKLVLFFCVCIYCVRIY